MAFTDVATKGIQNIYENDLEEQRRFLQIFCENVRNADLETLMEMRCFFVPNNDYLIPFFGEGVFDWQNDIYMDGHCKWNNKLVIPLFDVAKECVAFIGFDFLTKAEDLERGENNGPYYSVSSAAVFSSGKYLFFPGKSFEKAFSEGYIVIVDGIFDAINLYSNGINACSFLGSAVTWERMLQLQFIPNIYVAQDNDKAGRKLFESIRKYRSDVLPITQNIEKDADAVISSRYASEYLEGIRRAIEQRRDFSIAIKPEFNILADI